MRTDDLTTPRTPHPPLKKKKKPTESSILGHGYRQWPLHKKLGKIMAVQLSFLSTLSLVASKQQAFNYSSLIEIKSLKDAIYSYKL